MIFGRIENAKVFFKTPEGDYEPLEIRNVETIVEEPAEDDENGKIINTFMDRACTVEIKDFDARRFQYQIIRAVMPNNWLKLHKIPMRRRKKHDIH